MISLILFSKFWYVPHLASVIKNAENGFLYFQYCLPPTFFGKAKSDEGANEEKAAGKKFSGAKFLLFIWAPLLLFSPSLGLVSPVANLYMTRQNRISCALRITSTEFSPKTT